MGNEYSLTGRHCRNRQLKRNQMRPILFNTDMVRAILEGRKTVTRRVVKPAPAGDGTKPEELTITRPGYWNSFGDDNVYRQPCKPGDILYVRETWCQYGKLDDSDRLIDGTEKYYYRAYGENPTLFNYFIVRHPGWDEYRETPVWHPSIHMPKDAARIFLRVTAVRVERLQDITPEQARAEGCDGRCNCPSSGSPGSLSCAIRDFCVEKFETVWDCTIKPADLDKYGWDANPWVWVIEFERISKEEALEGGNYGKENS